LLHNGVILKITVMLRPAKNSLRQVFE
jgi:hypothetical protein